MVEPIFISMGLIAILLVTDTGIMIIFYYFKKPTDTVANPQVSPTKPTINNPSDPPVFKYEWADFVQQSVLCSDLPNQPIIEQTGVCQEACNNQQSCIGFTRYKNGTDDELGLCWL